MLPPSPGLSPPAFRLWRMGRRDQQARRGKGRPFPMDRDLPPELIKP